MTKVECCFLSRDCKSRPVGLETLQGKGTLSDFGASLENPTFGLKFRLHCNKCMYITFYHKTDR